MYPRRETVESRFILFQIVFNLENKNNYLFKYLNKIETPIKWKVVNIFEKVL